MSVPKMRSQRLYSTPTPSSDLNAYSTPNPDYNYDFTPNQVHVLTPTFVSETICLQPLI